MERQVPMKTKLLPLLALVLAAALLLPLTGAADQSASSFPDVQEGSWYYANITEMTKQGYLKGYPDSTFRPDATITAAEFLSVTARVAGLSSSPAQNSHWAGPLLQTALDNGWYDWDELPPTGETYDQPILRQVAVKVIMRAFAPDATGDYNTESVKMKDFSSLDGRYYNEVLAAYAAGIANGDNKGNFNPKSPLTRAEACALITRAADTFDIEKQPYTEPVTPTPTPTVATQGGVSENGALQVIGTQLCNEKGEAVVLRGMSSHGIHWFPQFLTEEVISSTAQQGANLFRVAMYTAENGYLSNPATVKQTLIKAVDTAVSLDLYTIIDWHCLYDNNPKDHTAEAVAFFKEMATRYKGNPAILYEICNEPNGNVTWTGDVKPYAETVIAAIRSIDPNAVILVGSPTWSQDLHEVAKSPLTGQNIMYTCHFYAGTHTDWLRNRISTVLQQGLPVFISEWGVSDASGGGGVYTQEADRWLAFLNQNHISWANWSLCDKGESAAAIRSGANLSDGISTDELTPSGQYVFSHFKDK